LASGHNLPVHPIKIISFDEKSYSDFGV